MTVHGMDTISPQKQHQDIQNIFLIYTLWQLDLCLKLLLTTLPLKNHHFNKVFVGMLPC